MKAIFITTSQCKEGSGGGIVSLHEAKALEQFCDETTVIDFDVIKKRPELEYRTPFTLDYLVSLEISEKYDLVHFNGNPWRQTLKTLRYFNLDIKVVSSVPAHNLQRSIMEHKKLGIPHERLYPHLHKPELWKKYIEHINQSDLVIAPSNMSKNWFYDLPYINQELKVEIIPHGVDIPEKIPSLPEKFTPAYFGVDGVDKGTHLLPDSVKKFGKAFDNEYDNLYDLMSKISVGVFPSITEAFNICCLETMAYGRPVIVSGGAGISEYINTLSFPTFTDIEKMLEFLKTPNIVQSLGKECREIAKNFSWDKIEKQYVRTYESIT